MARNELHVEIADVMAHQGCIAHEMNEIGKDLGDRQSVFSDKVVGQTVDFDGIGMRGHATVDVTVKFTEWLATFADAQRRNFNDGVAEVWIKTGGFGIEDDKLFIHSDCRKHFAISRKRCKECFRLPSDSWYNFGGKYSQIRMIIFLKQKVFYLAAGCLALLLLFGFSFPASVSAQTSALDAARGAQEMIDNANKAAEAAKQAAAGDAATTTPAAGSSNPTGTAAANQATEKTQLSSLGQLEKVANTLSNFGETISRAIYGIMGSMLLKFTELLGGLLSIVMILIRVVAAYTGFSDQEQVIVGWTIVRDIVNSFFIVVLIAIAISTIIRVQAFNFRTTLPRLIIAAFLVNFSRTLCLIAINFSTSIMHTFVVHIEQMIPAFAIGLRLPALLASNDATINGLYANSIDRFATDVPKTETNFQTAIITLIMAIVMMIVALFAMFYFLIILLFRIIVLWFLMILSPLAFFLWGVPGKGQKYYGEWMDEFAKHVIIGPVTAFFLYIIIYFYVFNAQSNYGFDVGAGAGAQQIPQFTLTLTSSPAIIMGYVVSLGLMFVAFELTQKLGVRGGQFAAKVATQGTKKTFGALTAPFRYGASGAWWGAKKGLQGVGKLGYEAGRDVRSSLVEQGAWYSALLQPAEGWGAFVKGRENRIAGKLSRGRQLMAGKASDAELADQKVKSMFWNIGAANEQYFEKNSPLEMLDHTLKAVQSERGPGMSVLAGKMETLENRDAARIALSTTDGVAAIGNIGNLTAAKVTAASAFIDDYKAKKQQLDIVASLVEGRGEAADASNPDWAAAKSEFDAVLARRDALDRGITAADMESLIIDENTQKQAQAFAKKFESLSGADQGKTVSELAAELGAPQAMEADRKSKAALAKEMADRRSRSNVALAGAHADMMDKVDTYRSKTYKPEHDYDDSTVVNNMLAHNNDKDRYEFVGDMIQAAKAGRFESVMAKFNPEFKMNEDGFKAIAGHLNLKLGMELQDAYSALAKVQAYTAKDGKWTQSNIVKETPAGYKLREKDERTEAIATGFANQDLFNALIKAKGEGIATKNASGDLDLHTGIINAIKQGGNKLERILTNSRDISRLPGSVLKALSAAANKPDSFTLSKDARDDLAAAIRSQP